MRKIILFIILSSYVFGKSFTLSVGIENQGEFKNSYTTSSNPRMDIEYLNHSKKFAFGLGSSINYVNIDFSNYLLTTNLSLNTALNIIENDLYKVYLGLNLGYAYPFVTVNYNDKDIDFLKTDLYYELKVGTYYNDFNINLGISNVFLVKSVKGVESKDTISRLSINAGFLLF